MRWSCLLRGFTALVAVAALFGCGDDASGGAGGAGAAGGDGQGGSSSSTGGDGVGGYVGPTPETDCSNKVEPHDPIGMVVTVGDGTAASCTEAALTSAIGTLNATTGGTLLFDCGGEATITLTSSAYVTSSMMIDGGDLITLSGGGAVRVIELDHYLDFVLQRITIRDGFVAAGSADESGAGLLSPWFGTLEIIDCTFEDNVSASLEHDVGGGAIYAGGLTRAVISGSTFIGNRGSTGGAVLSRSTNLSVADTVFFDNTATSFGDGQFGNGGGLYIDRMWLDAPTDFTLCGGVFDSNHATVHGSALFVYDLEGSGATIDRTLFADNDMAGSPSGGVGSVYYEGVPLLLTGSTFSNNETGEHAGGLFLGGGTNATVVNSTFDDNRTPGNAGALWAGNGAVDITNVTFSRNSADYGPVIFKGQSGSVRLTNVVFSNNVTANEFSALACHETFDDGGGNVQFPPTKNNGNGDTPCAAGVLFADPGLAPLADNGGPTPTMAIGAGSPALDLADTCPEFDQRGMPRSGRCDAGAFELQP
ncbi:MAG: right-handed parallel beta-helix repeat-containing protein [Polyangiaceae bacterium]